MKKVNGIDTVRVSLKDGLTILDLKPGNAVTLAQLRAIIKNNGFVPKEASIVARGHITTVNGRQSVAVDGTRETLTPDGEVRDTSDGLRFVTKN
ncbi:MAG TPA: hypothetical protein VEU08_03980 [Vicinamibacterales bacterium]|nr:hypothetical protein [Vicinamibacterales bacterium]